MSEKIDLGMIFARSKDVVARDIQGEFILIPVASGIGELDEDIYSLNEAGRTIWDKLDGEKKLSVIAKELLSDFDAPPEDIEEDVIGLIEELFKRNMVLKK